MKHAGIFTHSVWNTRKEILADKPICLSALHIFATVMTGNWNLCPIETQKAGKRTISDYDMFCTQSTKLFWKSFACSIADCNPLGGTPTNKGPFVIQS